MRGKWQYRAIPKCITKTKQYIKLIIIAKLNNIYIRVSGNTGPSLNASPKNKL